MDLNLKNKVALITGGSKGIGYACAAALAAEGCLIRLAARDPASLETARAALAESYPAADVQARVATLPDHADELRDAFPDVDILVNSAGAVPRGSLLDVDFNALKAGLDGKVIGTIATCRAFYPLMIQRGSGVIINIIGIAGLRHNPKSVGTTTSNAALIAFTQALGTESVDHGVRVVGVNPGLVRTDRTVNALQPTASVDQAYGALMKSLPLGRMGEPAEIASAVAFLASDLSAYTSGEVLAVDGGARFRL